MLFKLSNLNSNLALTLGYLNPALNNSALKYNLRTENNIQKFNTVRYGKHSMRHFGPNLRSRLPKEIRNISSFRSRIRKTNIAELVSNSNRQSCYLRHS